MSSAKAQLESDTKVCAAAVLHTYANVWLLLNCMRMLTDAGVFCYTCMCMLLHLYADVCCHSRRTIL